MKSFIKWVVRHWKCVAGMAISMAGVCIATTGEYQAGLDDARGINQAMLDKHNVLGRDLTDEEMRNTVDKWIKKTYE